MLQSITTTARHGNESIWPAWSFVGIVVGNQKLDLLRHEIVGFADNQ
jgi:hypothetical protein